MNDDAACPFCNSEDDCDHLLLRVDLTFRYAVSGALYSDFRAKWGDILDENTESDDFDEGEAFSSLLDHVVCLADAESYSEFEGGPGQSSDYQAFYCSSKKSISKALATWRQDNL